MAAQIAQDESEEFDKMLAFCEYIASFINFEAVQAVQRDRKSKSARDDEAFKKVVESLSGRQAPEFQNKD